MCENQRLSAKRGKEQYMLKKRRGKVCAHLVQWKGRHGGGGMGDEGAVAGGKTLPAKKVEL